MHTACFDSTRNSPPSLQFSTTEERSCSVQSQQQRAKSDGAGVTLLSLTSREATSALSTFSRTCATNGSGKVNAELREGSGFVNTSDA
eukprot:2936510-Rhodomonas_salina.1